MITRLPTQAWKLACKHWLNSPRHHHKTYCTKTMCSFPLSECPLFSWSSKSTDKTPEKPKQMPAFQKQSLQSHLPVDVDNQTTHHRVFHSARCDFRKWSCTKRQTAREWPFWESEWNTVSMRNDCPQIGRIEEWVLRMHLRQWQSGPKERTGRRWKCHVATENL